MRIENNIAGELKTLHVEQNKTAVKYLKKRKAIQQEVRVMYM